MQSKFIKWTVVIIVFLITIFTINNQYNSIKLLKSEIANKEAVINSFELENSNLINEAIIQNRTISELNRSNDSINKKLIEKVSELKLKESRIKELEYIKQKASRIDSIFIKDTIFVDKFALDTTILDEWYKLQMTMRHPNLVVVNPEFNSELNIIKHVEKEYLNKPKKFWLCRLFQKKILVEKVEVIENNPYVKTIKYRDIEIIDK